MPLRAGASTDSNVESPLSGMLRDVRLWPTAAVPYVRRKRVLEESGSCREGQLTGLVANSRNRPGAVNGRGAEKRTVAARTAPDTRLPAHDESAKGLVRRKIQDCMIHSCEPMTRLHIPYLLVLPS